MARALRIDIHGGLYHVTSRGLPIHSLPPGTVRLTASDVCGGPLRQQLVR